MENSEYNVCVNVSVPYVTAEKILLPPKDTIAKKNGRSIYNCIPNDSNVRKIC